MLTNGVCQILYGEIILLNGMRKIVYNMYIYVTLSTQSNYSAGVALHMQAQHKHWFIEKETGDEELYLYGVDQKVYDIIEVVED